jgi:3-oxoadipate enol-lactonase
MSVRISEEEVRLDDHTTLARESDGTGVPLILLHALSMDSNFWMHGVFERMASDNTRKVIAYDLRGHGRAADAPPAVSAEQLADDLRTFCLVKQLQQVDVAGISYGGAVAQYFALASPDLLRSASFIATTPQGVPAFAERASAAEAHGMDALMEPSMSRWFLRRSLDANTPGVQYASKQLRATRVANWAAAWRVLSRVDTLERLQGIQAPVLCLAAKEDTSTPPAFLQRIAERCPRATLRIVEGGMHFFPLEVPEATAVELLAFLDGLKAPA